MLIKLKKCLKKFKFCIKNLIFKKNVKFCEKNKI